MRPSCLTAVRHEAGTSAVSGLAITLGPRRELTFQAGLRAEIGHWPVSATPVHRLRMPLVSATALHATCLAAALMFAHGVRPRAPQVVAFVVQPEPAAGASSPAVKAAAVTEPRGASVPRPEMLDPSASDAPQVAPVIRPETPEPPALDAPRAPSLSQPETPEPPVSDPPQAALVPRLEKPPAPDELQAPPASVIEQSVALSELKAPPAENPVEAIAPKADATVPQSSDAILPDPPPPPPRSADHEAHIRATYHPVTAAPAGLSTHAPQPVSRAVAAGKPLSSAAAAQQAAAPAQAAEQQSVLAARIRDAVQEAVRYPAAARMMGVTGRARVRLDYQGGVVDDPSLAQSSGTPMLDHAAISAARTAHYPPPPPALAGRLMRFLVWVEFRSA